MSCYRKAGRCDIVKTVFYAVVASAWASVVINNCDAVSNFIGSICCSVRSHAVSDLFLQHHKAWLSIGVMSFLTLYFHDEWAYGESEEYPHESPVKICFAWLAFLVQVCLIPVSARAFAIAGIVGIAIITIGLAWPILFREKVKCARFACENFIWGVTLVVVACKAEYAVSVSIVPCVIILFRCCPIGLPKTSAQKES